jgi:hypothetical protein
MQSGNDLNHRLSFEEALALLPERIRLALTDQPTELSEDLKKLVFLKSFLELQSEIQIQSFRKEGFSTYTIQHGSNDIATVQFAPLFNGEYLIRKTWLANKQVLTTTEHYDENGRYLGRYTDPSPNLLYVNLTEMEPDCPIVSHLYNILLHEYQQADQGQAKSARIRVLEKILQNLDRDPPFNLSFRQKPLDPAYIVINQKMAENEIDSALTFSNKRAVRKTLKTERATILRVKRRVHPLWAIQIRLQLLRNDVSTRAMGFRKKPIEKTIGFLHQYTIGVLSWFFGIVRNNIGYSVALAIYAPFTFYFITQPMNPGAMWAVGEVRKAYISSAEFIKALTPSALLGLDKKLDQNEEVVREPEASATSQDSNLPYDPSTPYAHVKTQFAGMILSTDVPDVEKQSWGDRMSNFKAMEIAYESSLQFSQRMGRLEQMENQLNFPLIAESAYREMETYAMRVESLQKAIPSPLIQSKPEVKKYIDNELQRTRQFKLYIWDRMVRYMLDHPYIVMNQGKDQAYVDYYVGRNFIFLEEITRDLMKEFKGLKKPAGYHAIEGLAKFYESKKVEGSSVEDRLKKNSFLYKQKGFYDSAEMRASLKRQWEVLYLSQNRAQEAANFGLAMYVWSVRNAIWAIGNLTSAKSREMELITASFTAGSNRDQLKNLVKSEQKRIEPMYESIFHILTFEYVSLRQEINQKLDDDIESTQRQTVIDALAKSFEERTTFLKSIDLN